MDGMEYIPYFQINSDRYTVEVNTNKFEKQSGISTYKLIRDDIVNALVASRQTLALPT